MNKKYYRLLYLVLMVNMISIGSVKAASMKEHLIVSLAAGGMCKSYAQDVGGDVQAFGNLNATLVQMADKLGYTNNLDVFTSDIKTARHAMEGMYLQKFGSERAVYNQWCIRFYNGFKRSFEQGAGVQ